MTIDTNAIWRALGSFFDLFPAEERIYWSTFWEAFADITSDLWGVAFQVDRAKSLFATSPTFERRWVLAKITNLTEDAQVTFQVSSLRQDSGGRWILRGFVPRELRSFKAADLPPQGSIRIGVDIIDYLSVNVSTVIGGVYDGFIEEATFVLASQPPHEYADSPDFNDAFDPSTANLKIRVPHIGGETFVDAVLIDPTQPVIVNPAGTLVLGSSGVNQEQVDYTSVAIIGDRYLFTLATSWQAPATGPQELAFAHPVNEYLTVFRHDAEKWTQRRSGPARVQAQGEIRLALDNQPVDGTTTAELMGHVELRDNVDFDVAVVVDLRTWPAMGATAAVARRRAGARLRVAASTYFVGVDLRRDALGVQSHVIIGGVETALSDTIVSSPPSIFEARFVRTGAVLECQFKNVDTGELTVLDSVPITGERATIELSATDIGVDTNGAVVVFDEVVRRTGEIAGSQRLEEYFVATTHFPYTYDLDQKLSSATALIDRPRVRTETLAVISDITDPATTSIKAVASDTDFQSDGVPDAGVITINGKAAIYDSYTRRDDVFEFFVRGKFDPDLFPIATGTLLTVSTRQLAPDTDFELPGDGTVSLRVLPTRDRMWAPMAQVDIGHVQASFGRLVDLDADDSTLAYLRRVQGVWFALMNGPAIRNVHSGLQLTMGLPVAQIDGTVTEIRDEFDALGQITRRVAVVANESNAVEHDLDPRLSNVITWAVAVGQQVDRYQPLTNGVEVLDFFTDPLWHERFVGVQDVERFNSFGVFVAIEAINPDASINDALRFALRIKPTYTKLFMRFLLTSGNEDLSNDLDDDVFAAHIPHLCEDMSFVEGQVPGDPLQILRLGEGHKLGQGKKLGGTGLWHVLTLGIYDVVDVLTADGSATAASTTFATAGGYTFTTADVGRVVHIEGLSDRKIMEILSASSVRVSAPFPATITATDWQLRDYLSLGEGLKLGTFNAFVCPPGDENLPVETVEPEQIVSMSMTP